jgi:outer membrane protein OmpA-like peptidoglycan-associated protein
MERGVEESRLKSIGYGESKPLDPSNTTAAHDMNRRVEFFVEEWDADLAPVR